MGITHSIRTFDGTLARSLGHLENADLDGLSLRLPLHGRSSTDFAILCLDFRSHTGEHEEELYVIW